MLVVVLIDIIVIFHILIVALCPSKYYQGKRICFNRNLSKMSNSISCHSKHDYLRYTLITSVMVSICRSGCCHHRSGLPRAGLLHAEYRDIHAPWHKIKVPSANYCTRKDYCSQHFPATTRFGSSVSESLVGQQASLSRNRRVLLPHYSNTNQ